MRFPRPSRILLAAVLLVAAMAVGRGLPAIAEQNGPRVAQVTTPPAPPRPPALSSAPALLPSLALTWGSRATHAGVPVSLTIQSRDALGADDGTRSGDVLLYLDDGR